MFSSASSSSPCESNNRFETKNSALPLSPPMTPVVSPDLAGFSAGVQVSRSSLNSATPFSIDQNAIFSSSSSTLGFVETAESLPTPTRDHMPRGAQDTSSDYYLTPSQEYTASRQNETPLSEATLIQIQYAAFSPDVHVDIRESKLESKQTRQEDFNLRTPINGFVTHPAASSLSANSIEATPTARLPSTSHSESGSGFPTPVPIDNLARDLFIAKIASPWDGSVED